MKQFGVFGKVAVYAGYQSLCRHIFGVKHMLHNGSEGVGSSGQAYIVDSEVLVLGRIHQQIQERCRNEPQVFDIIADSIQTGPDFIGNRLVEIFQALTAGQVSVKTGIYHLGNGQGCNVSYISSNARNNELPAGGHSIFYSILGRITHFNQPGENYIVVGILREA